MSVEAVRPGQGDLIKIAHAANTMVGQDGLTMAQWEQAGKMLDAKQAVAGMSISNNGIIDAGRSEGPSVASAGVPLAARSIDIGSAHRGGGH